MIKFTLIFFYLFLLLGCSSSLTLSVPDQFKTIQDAVNAASYGDTVLVEPGIYYETITLKPGVILKSSGDDSKGKLGLLRTDRIRGGGEGGDRLGLGRPDERTPGVPEHRRPRGPERAGGDCGGEPAAESVGVGALVRPHAVRVARA